MHTWTHNTFTPTPVPCHSFTYGFFALDSFTPTTLAHHTFYTYFCHQQHFYTELFPAPHFEMHFLHIPILHHLLSLSCLSHPGFTFLWLLIGRSRHLEPMGSSGPITHRNMPAQLCRSQPRAATRWTCDPPTVGPLHYYYQILTIKAGSPHSTKHMFYSKELCSVSDPPANQAWKDKQDLSLPSCHEPYFAPINFGQKHDQFPLAFEGPRLFIRLGSHVIYRCAACLKEWVIEPVAITSIWRTWEGTWFLMSQNMFNGNLLLFWCFLAEVYIIDWSWHIPLLPFTATYSWNKRRRCLDTHQQTSPLLVLKP